MQVDVWDHERSEPVSGFSWGSETVTSVRFNPAEPDLLASAGSDRSIALYDLRLSTPIRKIIMQVLISRARLICMFPICLVYTYACAFHPIPFHSAHFIQLIQKVNACEDMRLLSVCAEWRGASEMQPALCFSGYVRLVSMMIQQKSDGEL